MEMNSAYPQNEGPRELEIFSDEQVEEVMESLEYFRSKIEQLQVYCEQVSQSKLKSDETVLKQKRKHHEEMLKCQEEVNLLRNINVQLMLEKVDSAEKRGNFSCSLLSSAIDSENAESRIQEMKSKLRSVELTLLEKEKHFSIMECQVVDMEATIAILQAERDQLILEQELHDCNGSIIHSSESLRGMGREDDYSEDDRHAEKENRRKVKTLASGRPHSHSDLWGGSAGTENLSLRQLMGLSVEWLPKDTPVRARKPPQRTFSDCVKRDSRTCSAGNFSSRNTTHSLEDFDNLSEVDSGLGLGKLTRTTNFCDILDADEYSNIHVTDNRLSFTGDSVQEEQASNDGEHEMESSLESLANKWETFDGDRQIEETLDKTISVDKMVVSESVPTEEPFGAFDGHSLTSSVSDFSSAFNSSQDILLSSTEGPWPSSNNTSCVELIIAEAPHKKLSKKNISKSDSCITMKRSLSSDKEDMWNFTPDSIFNVSTGEVLTPTVTKRPSTPTIKKSRSFTSSLEIILKNPKTSRDKEEHEWISKESKGEHEGISKDETANTERDTTGDTGKDSEEPKDTENICGNDDDTVVIAGEQPVKLRITSGENLRVKRNRKSRSVIVSSTNQTESHASKAGAAVHQKSLSDPVMDGEKNGPRKLTEYQKWRKYGRKGKPPGDLRISDC